ncbi:Neutral protease [Seminavis robusta]|uniref:Neutral protease n=1 Tax=Seminavis robusta TaxID=568900 RepID=A0A9N8F0D4_9STRA|nr:Neutral protease [Seminavis robusta]|eukprot:Sro2396_g325980.1 Neutral protease (678) ;mRNA; f:2721-4986
MSFFSNTAVLVLVVTIWLVHTSTVKGVRGPAPGDEGQCDGRLLDLSRLETMRGFGQGPGGSPGGSTPPVISREGIVIDTDSWYTVKGGPIVPFAISRRNMECNYGRSRLREELQGVPVYGADMIMSFGGNCAPGGNSRNYEWWSAEDQPENAPPMSLTQILNDFQVRDMFAKSFRDVRVPQGYTPAFSIDKAKEIVADFYNIPAQDIDSNVTLYVYPSQPQDYLTYFVEVIVPVPGSTAVYRVVLDAHSAEFLSVCTFVDPDVDRRRREHVQQEVQKQQEDDNNRHLLRANDKNRRLQDICQSCAVVEDIASFLGTTTCPINTLYLDDSGKTVTCTQATTTSGGTIFVPYPDTALFWNGAYDCQNSVGPCSLVDIPDCQDAISDVTFSALQTLQYLQSSLNVLGGLSSDASVPQWLNGLVHYDTDYCNAFYSSNRIVFGDCDCDILTPLVSIDITAHEVMHGVTQKHSNLEYSGESGGLNEGYSDIMGSVMEFVINDSQDTPDFTLGEVLGGFYGIIRFMEDPPLDGQSVGSICDYTSSLNVHHSSGILNKAFVKAVRACQANGCLSTEFDCTLLVGPLFLYTNLQLLTSLSTFLDGALQTCIMVEEFLDTIAEYDSCDQETLTQFVIDGWAAVDITIDSTSCNSATTSCSGTTPNPTPAPRRQQSQSASQGSQRYL